MDSIQLSTFFRGVSSWPTTEQELQSVADKIRVLLDVPIAAIHVLEPARERCTVSFADSSNSAFSGFEETFKEFLKKQIKQPPVGPSPGLLRQMHIAPESIPKLGRSSESSGPLCLTFAAISGEVRGNASFRENRYRKDFGGVVIGSYKPLNPKEEIILIAVAERLTEVAEIAEFEAAIQLRSQFLSIASHELKTPLTSIYGMLQLQERMFRLKKDDPLVRDPEKQQAFLKRIIRQVERLNELINGLLDVSRIQNGRFMVEPSETDVAALLREMVTTRLDPISAEAGVKIYADAPEHLIAHVDPVRMEEVITNLVMNAIRFSPEGGVVWIKLREDSGAFRLTVRDQGPSVPIEDRERIFQPFERAPRTARLGGLGLGLFISRQIALLHGGNVTLVESVPGKGNVLEAHFPSRGLALNGAAHQESA